MTSKRCRIDVDATSSRRIDVNTTSCQRCVPAGIRTDLRQDEYIRVEVCIGVSGAGIGEAGGRTVAGRC